MSAMRAQNTRGHGRCASERGIRPPIGEAGLVLRCGRGSALFRRGAEGLFSDRKSASVRVMVLPVNGTRCRGGLGLG